MYSDGVTFLLVKLNTNRADDASRLPLALARDPADILWINNDSVKSHDCRVLRFSKSPELKRTKTVTTGVTTNRTPRNNLIINEKNYC